MLLHFSCMAYAQGNVSESQSGWSAPHTMVFRVVSNLVRWGRADSGRCLRLVKQKLSTHQICADIAAHVPSNGK